MLWSYLQKYRYDCYTLQKAAPSPPRQQLPGIIAVKSSPGNSQPQRVRRTRITTVFRLRTVLNVQYLHIDFGCLDDESIDLYE